MGEETTTPVEGTTTENATTPENVEPFDLSAVNNKASEDAYFNALILQMQNEKEELMKEPIVANMFAK